MQQRLPPGVAAPPIAKLGEAGLIDADFTSYASPVLPQKNRGPTPIRLTPGKLLFFL